MYRKIWIKCSSRNASSLLSLWAQIDTFSRNIIVPGSFSNNFLASGFLQRSRKRPEHREYTTVLAATLLVKITIGKSSVLDSSSEWKLLFIRWGPQTCTSHLHEISVFAIWTLWLWKVRFYGDSYRDSSSLMAFFHGCLFKWLICILMIKKVVLTSQDSIIDVGACMEDIQTESTSHLL